jgi:hypothetical protein
MNKHFGLSKYYFVCVCEVCLCRNFVGVLEGKK